MNTELKTRRFFTEEDGNVVSVREDVFTNGLNRKVVRMTYEYDIPIEELDETIKKHIPEKDKEIKEKEEEFNTNIEAAKKIYDSFKDDPEYKKYRDVADTKEFKTFHINLDAETKYFKLLEAKEAFDKEVKDINDWKVYIHELYDAIKSKSN